MKHGRIGLAAFDLDGTLLRGETVCEGIARQLDRHEQMKEFEGKSGVEAITAAREEMRDWYSSASLSELCSKLPSLQLAPGVREGFSLLKRNGVKTAIVSITWEFAVEWFSRLLEADYFVGVRLSPDRQITHFWPHDKPIWVAELARDLGLDLGNVAAVGDSLNDLHMLRVVGHPFFVGAIKPEGLEESAYFPEGDILQIAKQITEFGSAGLGQ